MDMPSNSTSNNFTFSYEVSSLTSILPLCLNDTGLDSFLPKLVSPQDEDNKTLSELCNITIAGNSDSDQNIIPPKLEALLVASLGLMIIATIIGNILVCLSVVLVRKLRHPSNYLLVSLAISDMCVATLVMPLALHNELSGGWNLGPSLCDMWVSFDVTCCTSSILNLCMISIDRYLAITKPLTYGVKRTTKRILSLIAAVWIASCLISIPPLLVLGNEHGSDDEPKCEVSQNIGYQLYATLGAFYIPLTVMIVMYYKIYVAAKRVVDAELRAQVSSTAAAGGNRTPQMAHLRKNQAELSTSDATLAVSPKNVWLRVEECINETRKECNSYDDNTQATDRSEMMERTRLREPGDGTAETIPINVEHYYEHNANNLPSSRSNGIAATYGASLKPYSELEKDDYRKRCSSESSTFNNNSPNLRAVNKRRSSSVLRERKASITLGVIMTAFTVCWLPFFILALLRPFSASVDNIPHFIVSTCLWLGYANSMLNPIIYVTFHQDFRRAFKYLLCFQCATMGSRLRAEAYKSQFGTDRPHWDAPGTTSGTAGGGFETTYTAHGEKLQHFEHQSTQLCSNFEISSKQKTECEATL